MRASSIKTALYVPGDPPVDSSENQRFLRAELAAIAAAIQKIQDGHMDPMSSAPTKPRDGDWRYADGINWDPGGGAAFYRFDGNAWNQLG